MKNHQSIKQYFREAFIFRNENGIIKIVVLFLLLICNLESSGQIKIKGHIELDSTWSRKIYASNIPSLGDLYKCSNSLVVSSSHIDDTGFWELNIPEESYPRIIRIHVSKKTYPPLSLIIGGVDNNHAFIAVGKTKELIYSGIGKGLFSDFTCDDLLNNKMRKIKAFFDKSENDYQTAKEAKNKMNIRLELAKDLIKMTDTISDKLPAIYAAHLSDMGFNRENVYKSMANLESKYGTHPYLEEYTIGSKQSKTTNTLLILFTVLLISFISYELRVVYSANHKQKLINSLSTRELDVFNLAISKTNKEISEVLNIEISTVKSHLHSIYNKLEITSRNDLKRFS